MASILDAVSRRRGSQRIHGMTQAPNLPSPELTPGVPPTFIDPTKSVPAADVTASPNVDLKGVLASLEPKEEPDTVRDAVGRALIGFSRGVAMTPSGAGNDSGLGGIAGGISAIGQGFADESAARSRADEPRRKIVQAILETQAQEATKDPYRQAQEAREQAGRRDLQDDRFKQTRKMLGDRSAQGAANLKISVSDYLKLQEDAGNELLFQGVTPDTPGYAVMLDQAVRSRAEKAKSYGASGVTIPKAPVTAPRLKPRTAAEFLSQ